jgi:HrpA-like RNA helicase
LKRLPLDNAKYVEPAPHSVLKSHPPPQPKIILATNIAETSITINGVRYVIDTGLVKQRHFDARKGMEVLALTAVSKAQVCVRS